MGKETFRLNMNTKVIQDKYVKLCCLIGELRVSRTGIIVSEYLGNKITCILADNEIDVINFSPERIVEINSILEALYVEFLSLYLTRIIEDVAPNINGLAIEIVDEMIDHELITKMVNKYK